jgi:hypothetical protein
MVRLETLLGCNRADLRRVAATAGAYYAPFYKTERQRPFQKKFKARKPRRIDNPKGELKVIQGNIYKRILKRIPLPENILGGVSGATIQDNARIHIGAKTLAKIDVKSYFPTVTNRHVYVIWRQVLNCSPEIASLLTQLTTFERHLPQGAPTSTLLGNLVMCALDSPIRISSRFNDVGYSGWVDDLAFSGENPRPIINVAIHELAKAGFSVSRRKVKVMGPASQKILTGVRLGQTPRADPKQLSRVRSGIHKLQTGEVPPSEVSSYVRSLEGLIAHLARFERKKAERLSDELRAAAATISNIRQPRS